VDDAVAPVVVVRADDASAESGCLQRFAFGCVHVPQQDGASSVPQSSVTTKLDRCSLASAFLTRTSNWLRVRRRLPVSDCSLVNATWALRSATAMPRF